MSKFQVGLLFCISLFIGICIDLINYNIGFQLDYTKDTGYDIMIKIAYIIFLSSIHFTAINILTAYYIKEHTKKSILGYLIMKVKPQKKPIYITTLGIHFQFVLTPVDLSHT